MGFWRTLHNRRIYTYHIRLIQNLELAGMYSLLELCCRINSNPHMIRNILFNDKAHFTPKKQETPIYGIVIIHVELSKE